ncbi:hypothetical protein K474DRAFT_1773875 [Panus rudis PR-1116 ss-1]|nr:hypothetical protein K474DRAFT_1773875 [Panus rudis PR-1116 ss-1]
MQPHWDQGIFDDGMNVSQVAKGLAGLTRLMIPPNGSSIIFELPLERHPQTMEDRSNASTVFLEAICQYLANLANREDPPWLHLTFVGLVNSGNSWSWVSRAGTMYPRALSLTMEYCSFRNLDSVKAFTERFSYIQSFSCKNVQWPRSCLVNALSTDNVAFTLPTEWTANLKKLSIRVSSLGDIWFLRQLNSRAGGNLQKLVIEWDDGRWHDRENLKLLHELRHIDLRRHPCLCDLRLTATSIMNVNRTYSSVVGMASRLLDRYAPAYASDDYRTWDGKEMRYYNWLNTVTLDLTSALTTHLSTGLPSSMKDQINDLWHYLRELAQASTMDPSNGIMCLRVVLPDATNSSPCLSEAQRIFRRIISETDVVMKFMPASRAHEPTASDVFDYCMRLACQSDMHM